MAGGLDADLLREQIRKIRELQPRYKIRIFAGSECDILADGAMDFPPEVLGELDIVLAAVRSRFTQSRAEMTARIVRALGPAQVLNTLDAGQLLAWAHAGRMTGRGTGPFSP